MRWALWRSASGSAIPEIEATRKAGPETENALDPAARVGTGSRPVISKLPYAAAKASTLFRGARHVIRHSS